MGLSPIVPNPDDLKRTMGQMPPLSAGLGQPPGPEPASGGLGSMGTLPPLSGGQSEMPQMSGLRPIVTNPRQQQEQELQQKISSFENPAKPQGFWQKLGHVLAQNPYTMAYRNTMEQNRVGELAGLQQQDIAQQEAANKGRLESAQADYYHQHGQSLQQHQVTPEEASAMGNPDLAGSLMDPKAWEGLIKQQGINQTKLTTTQETNQLKQEIAKLKPEQRDDKAIRLMQAQDQGQPLSQDDQAYLKSYAQWVNQTKTQPGVARAAAFGAFRPVQYVDDAGNSHYMFSGQAVAQGANINSPQSMNFRTAVGMSKFMTSGKGGQTITAYNTANDHLELLGKAFDALQNGDVQALNQMNNAFKQQFGSSAPTNVDAVKAMLAGELGNVAKVTGATDQEIKEQKDNINRASSPDQIKGFIDTNHDLMDQKAYELFQQYQRGEQGRPAFNTGLTGRGPASAGGGGGVIRARDEKGVLHEAPAGTPLPKGWKKE
jgi:hypothetical protein